VPWERQVFFFDHRRILWISVDGPAKSESPVKNGGKPSHYFSGFNHPFGGAGFRNLPQMWKTHGFPFGT
jgi:hypothetical protein